MFQRTRIQLTVLNSLVFIILIGVLGSIIYGYTYNRIYSGVDNSLEMFKAKEKKHSKSNPKGSVKDIRIGDPRITVLLWHGKK